ncbi:LPXTG-site transpeptidase (sortase) family protein [Glaciihabitans tibetensis]|uniref:LPXTG-site transpeptidase (Sortase) family protein n=1 Tax=Glaciihabitans tibetensis TaxID=1266600 RepID=A0A2T0VCM7_9MICO|nr:class E sortase [Glaciihabitans tibetensis]PRY67930.1 LPXTG-site transpeptidase (sortase) family protein [Glaciihabitans tibetensis]
MVDTATPTPMRDRVDSAKVTRPGIPPLRRGGPPPRRRTSYTLPTRPAVPRQLAPRDARWWIGAAVLVVSMLLIGFVVHATLFSWLQHSRSQDIAFQDLRTSLAKADIPVGQLDVNEDLVALGTPVSLLSIPEIGLTETVVEGSTASVLRTGPGHRRDSVMPGQAGTSVILGRQTTYGGPFRSVGQLVPGDEITITTGQGVHIYTVFGVRRNDDPLPEVLKAGAGRLELITADGLALFPGGALHIDAELTSDVQPTPTKVMTYQALPKDERAMGQDGEAWFAALTALAVFIGAGITLWWLWRSWGRWHTWLIGTPIMLALGVTTADAVMAALPNLI